MGRGINVSWTTGNAVASGGTVAHHKTGLPNAFNILKFKAVPSAGSGPSTLIATQKDTLTTTDLVLEWKAVSGNLYDPMDLTSGTPAEMPATDIIAAYDDEDLTGEFHMKATNNDSVDKTYTCDLTYEEVWTFDSGRVATAQKAELLGDALYFGGRTSSHVLLKGSGTWLQLRLGDDSADALLTVSGLIASDAAAYIGGTTATDVLLTRSGGRLYVKLGDNSLDADINVSHVFATGGDVFLGGTASSDVRLKKSGAHLLSIRKGDDSDYADVICGTLAPATFNYTFGNYTGPMSYLDGAGVPQTANFTDGFLTSPT